MLKGKCYANCPKGYYGNTSSGKCQACSHPCSECALDKDQSPPSKISSVTVDNGDEIDMRTTCTRCHKGYFLFKGKCLKDCPSRVATKADCTDPKTCHFKGYYADLKSRECKKCDPSCRSCNPGSGEKPEVKGECKNCKKHGD